MPSWYNQSARLFHGTDTSALQPIVPIVSQPLTGFSVSLARCRTDSDFGRGFYLTTNELQAREWAEGRVRRARSARYPVSTNAVLLSFDIGRDALASLDALCFVRPTPDYYALVDDCRNGFAPHGRSGRSKAYDIVYGPVRMWPQRLVIFDGDQVSFNTAAALKVLPIPTVSDIASAANGLF